MIMSYLIPQDQLQENIGANLILKAFGQDQNDFEKGKQVGDLYHYTSPKYAHKIISQDQLNGHTTDRFDPSEKPTVSTTRDKNFHEHNHHIHSSHVRLTLNGDTLSNNHKIKSRSFGKKGRTSPWGKEAEESVNGSVKGINKHIKHVDIFNTHRTTYSDGSRSPLIKDHHQLPKLLREKNISYKIHGNE